MAARRNGPLTTATDVASMGLFLSLATMLV